MQIDIYHKGKKRFSVSVWLKRKTIPALDGTSSPATVFVWILQKVADICISLTVTDEGDVLESSDSCSFLFGEDSDGGDISIGDIVPSFQDPLDKRLSLTSEDFSSRENCVAIRHDGVKFPAILRLVRYDAEEKVYSLELRLVEAIGGIVTVLSDGKVHGCNDTFSKFLFGIPATELRTGTCHISSLIDNIYASIEAMSGLSGSFSTQGSLSGKYLANHRDLSSAQFPVHVEISCIPCEDQNIYALWVTYRYEHEIDRNSFRTSYQSSSSSGSSSTNTLSSSARGVDATKDKISKIESPAEFVFQKDKKSKAPADKFLGDYVVSEKKLGEGAYGAVYLAHRKTDFGVDRVRNLFYFILLGGFFFPLLLGGFRFPDQHLNNFFF
jgi:hypothetical protein